MKGFESIIEKHADRLRKVEACGVLLNYEGSLSQFEFVRNILTIQMTNIPAVLLVYVDWISFGKKYTRIQVEMGLGVDRHMFYRNVPQPATLDDKYEVVESISETIQIIRLAEAIHNIKIDTPYKIIQELVDKIQQKQTTKYIEVPVTKECKKPKRQKTYIIYDEHTGYYKIGKSINPAVRERTLQAEKPTLKLIHVFKKNIERELHLRYNGKRIRGEWFALQDSDVTDIVHNHN